MRILSWVLVTLFLGNAALFALRHTLSEQRVELVERASAQSRKKSDERALQQRDRAVGGLVTKARERSRAPRDIGELRDILLSAEQGLGIERLSLDFRPDERIPAGLGGSRVDTSLQGPYDAIYQYLERIEAMFLPLSPENLTLRGDGSRVTLDVQWTARWPLANAAATEPEILAAEVSPLSRWLSRQPPPALERNPFAIRSSEPPAELMPVVEAPEVAPQNSRNDEPERPTLTGFVLARPELEPDVRRRVLAALRYAGEMHLLMVGETIGTYRIESMEARESVTLMQADTGERIRLTLE